MNILNTLVQMSYFSNMRLDIFGGRKHENFKIIIFYSAKELWKPGGSKILPSREDLLIRVTLELPSSSRYSPQSRPLSRQCLSVLPSHALFLAQTKLSLPWIEIKRYCLSINFK